LSETKISIFLLNEEKNISTPLNITSNALHLIKVENIYFMLSKMEEEMMRIFMEGG